MKILPILTKWAKVIMQATAAADQLNAVGMQPEAPIIGALWAATDALTAATEREIWTASGWLTWYAWENAMGANALEAGYDGELREIRTLDDLAWLIGKELERADSARPDPNC